MPLGDTGSLLGVRNASQAFDRLIRLVGPT